MNICVGLGQVGFGGGGKKKVGGRVWIASQQARRG